MGKYKTKAIQADLGIFTQIPAYSGISRHIQPNIIRHIQAYSEPCVTLINSEPDAYSEPWYIQKPGLFRTLVCSKPWHIQNQGHIHDPDIFRTQTYLEPSLFRTPEHFGEIVNILYEINTLNVFNGGVIFTSIAYILYRKSMAAYWTGCHEF